MRTIIAVLFYIEFIFSLLILTPKVIYMHLSRKRMTEKQLAEMTYKTANKLMRRQLRVARIKIETRGAENIPDGAVVYVGNHQSFVDIAGLLAVDTHFKGFIAKFEMGHVPILRTLMPFMKCVFIDRNDIRQSAKAINEGIANVKNGYSMVIYPEGTRSRAHNMIDWKPGAFKLATKSGAPIIPVTTFDSYKTLEETNYRIRSGKVIMIFHEPVPTAGLTREEQVALPDKIKAIIQRDLDDLAAERVVRG